MREKLTPSFRVVLIIFGSLLSSIAINEMLAPHRLLSGGVGGIALVIQYLTGISAGALILIINIPIFLIGIKETGRDFIVHSFIGTVSISLFLIVLRKITIFSPLRVDDVMLSSIFGGVMNGIGSGIVFRNRGSMGGSDIVAVIIKKKRSINVGKIIFSINIVIIFVSSLLYGVKRGMFSLVSMYISSVVLDKVQEGFDRKKSVFIICENEKQVADSILAELHRGVTLLHGEGAYTHKGREILYCIVTTRQLAQLKHIVESKDPKAFLTVTDAVEVLGRGFKKSGI